MTTELTWRDEQPQYVQPELLEAPVPETYTIELRRHEGEVVRHHEADNPNDAMAFVEALRDDAKVRYLVTWQTDEPVQSGKMYGLSAGKPPVTYEIAVIPALDLA
jgi:hypothetical protein